MSTSHHPLHRPGRGDFRAELGQCFQIFLPSTRNPFRHPMCGVETQANNTIRSIYAITSKSSLVSRLNSRHHHLIEKFPHKCSSCIVQTGKNVGTPPHCRGRQVLAFGRTSVQPSLSPTRPAAPACQQLFPLPAITTCSVLSLSLCLSLLSLFLSANQSDTPSFFLSVSKSFKNTHTLSLSLSYTHKHTHTHKTLAIFPAPFGLSPP